MNFMEGGMIFFTVIITGLGCGVGCGSVSNTFLMGRFWGEEQDVRQSMKSALHFCAGKVITLAILGLLSSFYGNIVINYLEKSNSSYITWVVRIICTSFGLMIVYRSLKKKSCSNCKSCKESTFLIRFQKRFSGGSYFICGIIYVLVPCVPLITTLGFATTLSPLTAMLLLVCFGISNSVFPILCYAPLTGLIVQNIKKEVPQVAKVFRVMAGCAVVVLGWI